jgi:DNA-directed RNA polymerase subunit RPC12/RpoP
MKSCDRHVDLCECAECGLTFRSAFAERTFDGQIQCPQCGVSVPKAATTANRRLQPLLKRISAPAE